MKPPILIANPRSGSTIIHNQMTFIAERYFGSLGPLNEYFHLQDFSKSIVHQNNKGKLSVKFELNHEGKYWEGSSNDEKIRRLNLLKINPNYTLKVFAMDITNDVLYNFILDNYTPIFLNRKNKIEQFLSWCSILTNNRTFFTKNESVNKIEYSYERFNRFYIILREYYELKERMGNLAISINYEDWKENNDILFDILNVKKFKLNDFLNNRNHKFVSIPTPYSQPIEDLIINKEEWYNDRDEIVEAFNELEN